MDASRTIAECDNSTTEISSNQIRVKDGGITTAKMASYNKNASSGSGTYVLTSTSYASILSVTLTASGNRPVMICLQPTEAVTTGGTIYHNTGVDLYFKLTGTASDVYWRLDGSDRRMPFIFYVDFPTSGSKTYTLYGKVSSGTTYIVDQKLLAYEL